MIKVPKLDWVEVATVRFKPKTVPQRFADLTGSCGTFALHCLTGESVVKISKECPKKGWWDDKSMRAYLKKRGYQTIPISLSQIQTSKPYQYRKNLNHQHVILMSAHSSEREGTWQVIYNNKVYHGTEVEFFTGYEVLINPVWTMYVVWHPKWKTNEEIKADNCKFQFISTTDDHHYHPLTGLWYNIKKKKIENPP